MYKIDNLVKYCQRKYDPSDIYTMKKVEYTVFFLLLTTLFTDLILVVAGLYDFSWEKEFISIFMSLIFLLMMLMVLSRGKLELVINLFIIWNFLIMILWLTYYEYSILFFVKTTVVLFSVGAIHIKRYQLNTIVIGAYALLIISAINPNKELYDSVITIANYRSSTLIGSIVYITCVYFFGQVVNRELQKRQQVTVLRETDVLTLLNNRHAYNRYTERMSSDGKMALMIMDLDYFKKINDTFGHDVGDNILREFGLLLAKYRNKSIEVFRIGGEEFALLYSDVSEADVRKLSIELHQATHSIIKPDGIPLTVSIGCVYVEGQWKKEELTDFYRAADEALYIAKEKGRNRIEYTNK